MLLRSQQAVFKLLSQLSCQHCVAPQDRGSRFLQQIKIIRIEIHQSWVQCRNLPFNFALQPLSEMARSQKFLKCLFILSKVPTEWSFLNQFWTLSRGFANKIVDLDILAASRCFKTGNNRLKWMFLRWRFTFNILLPSN